MLKAAKDPCLQLMGTARQNAGAFERFQQAGTDANVLLLNVCDESASGMNLTMVNCAIVRLHYVDIGPGAVYAVGDPGLDAQILARMPKS